MKNTYLMKKIFVTTALALVTYATACAQLMNQAKDMSRGYVDLFLCRQTDTV